VTSAATMILEGMYDVPPAVCLDRRIQRDTQQRGRTPEEVQWRFEKDVMPMYERFVYPSRVWATASAWPAAGALKWRRTTCASKGSCPATSDQNATLETAQVAAPPDRQPRRQTLRKQG